MRALTVFGPDCPMIGAFNTQWTIANDYSINSTTKMLRNALDVVWLTLVAEIFYTINQGVSLTTETSQLDYLILYAHVHQIPDGFDESLSLKNIAMC